MFLRWVILVCGPLYNCLKVPIIDFNFSMIESVQLHFILFKNKYFYTLAMHPLIVVMRLTKPSLMPYHPLISDTRDLQGELLQAIQKADIAQPDGVPYFGLGDLLTLPQNFG